MSESEEGCSGTNACVNISHFTFIAFQMGISECAIRAAHIVHDLYIQFMNDITDITAATINI